MILNFLNQKLIESQKSKDLVRLGVIRFLLSAIKNREIELRPSGKTIDDEEVLKVIRKQIKMRNDSIESYRAGNRLDLVEKENAEKTILEGILADVSTSNPSDLGPTSNA